MYIYNMNVEIQAVGILKKYIDMSERRQIIDGQIKLTIINYQLFKELKLVILDHLTACPIKSHV